MTTAHEKMPDAIDFADADFTATSHVNKRTLLSDEALLNIARANLKRGEVLKDLRQYVRHSATCTANYAVTAPCSCGLDDLLASVPQKK